MNNQHRKLYLCTLIVALALVMGPSAFAQQLANDCAGGGTGTILFGNADIPGTFTSTTRNSLANGIDTSSCGGNNSSTDGVICFTPTNSCTMEFVCNSPAPANTDAKVGSGTCDGTCTDTNGTNTISVALTAGTQYCLYCEHTAPGLLGFTLTETGDCGPLPVELESFSVSSTDGAEGEDSESESK